MKNYYVDKFMLNGNPIRIKFEQSNLTFFKITITNIPSKESRSIPLLLERNDVLHSMKTFRKIKKNQEGSLETFSMVIAGAVSFCMKYNNLKVKN